MIKVCIISGSFPYDKCGVGDYSSMLASALCKKNLDVSVVTSCKNVKNIENVSVFNGINDWNIKSLNQVLKIVDKIKPDIINIQYPTVAYGRKIMVSILPIFLKIKGYKVITTLHEYSIFKILGKLRMKPAIIASDAIIVVDPKYKKDIEKQLFCKSKNIEYINIGSNIPMSTLNENDIKQKKKILIKDTTKKIIGYFGFITESKGIESIFKAFKKLKDDDSLSSVLLMIAEFKSDNQYHQKLLKLIDDLNLKNNIIITGYLNDIEVANNLKLCDFVVLPFVIGASPKNGSMLAALQEGKTVITTKSDSIEDKFDNLILLDRYDNIPQLAKYIYELQFLENKNDEFKNNELEWDNIASRYIGIFNKYK